MRVEIGPGLDHCHFALLVQLAIVGQVPLGRRIRNIVRGVIEGIDEKSRICSIGHARHQGGKADRDFSAAHFGQADRCPASETGVIILAVNLVELGQRKRQVALPR